MYLYQYSEQILIMTGDVILQTATRRSSASSWDANDAKCLLGSIKDLFRSTGCHISLFFLHRFCLRLVLSFSSCQSHNLWPQQAHHLWLFVSDTHSAVLLTVSPPVVMGSCLGLVAPARVWSGTCRHKNNLWSASRSTHLHLWVHTVWTCTSTTTEHFIFTEKCPHFVPFLE